MTTRQVTGTIKAAHPRDGARGPYFEVEILRDGMQYPDKYQAFDDDATASAFLRDHIGERWTLDVERGNAKKEEPDPKRYGDWHWNLKGAVPGGSSQAASGQPEGRVVCNDRSAQIAWNSAVNNAVNILVAEYTKGEIDIVGPDILPKALDIYNLIMAGPPDSDGYDNRPLPFEDDDTEETPVARQRQPATNTKLRDCPDHRKPLLKVPAAVGDGLGHPIKDNQGQIERWCYGEQAGLPVG